MVRLYQILQADRMNRKVIQLCQSSVDDQIYQNLITVKVSSTFPTHKSWLVLFKLTQIDTPMYTSQPEKGSLIRVSLHLQPGSNIVKKYNSLSGV